MGKVLQADAEFQNSVGNGASDPEKRKQLATAVKVAVDEFIDVAASLWPEFRTEDASNHPKGKKHRRTVPRVKMSEHLFALLIHDQPEPFESLRLILKQLSVETYSSATCEEAKDLISQCEPHIIFTEISVADGSWMSIVDMAEAADVPLSVIVVGAVPDTRLYLSVMERGAFDFVAPPFEHEPLNFVIRSAALNTYRRREALARAAVA